MKKVLFIIIIISLLGCENQDDGNTFLPNIPVNQKVYLNNPTSQDLKISGGSIKIQGGILGIAVYNYNNTQFFAYDRACPSHLSNECSAMDINDGINLECSCDDYKYAMPVGGQPQNGSKFAARQYRVIKNGDVLTITNF